MWRWWHHKINCFSHVPVSPSICQSANLSCWDRQCRNYVMVRLRHYVVLKITMWKCNRTKYSNPNYSTVHHHPAGSLKILLGLHLLKGTKMGYGLTGEKWSCLSHINTMLINSRALRWSQSRWWQTEIAKVSIMQYAMNNTVIRLLRDFVG